MLDFFAVITKGGLVLWYFQDAAQQLKTSIDAINALIRNVVLQVRRQGICHSPATLMRIGYLMCFGSLTLVVVVICSYCCSCYYCHGTGMGGRKEGMEHNATRGLMKLEE